MPQMRDVLAAVPCAHMSEVLVDHCWTVAPAMLITSQAWTDKQGWSQLVSAGLYTWGQMGHFCSARCSWLPIRALRFAACGGLQHVPCWRCLGAPRHPTSQLCDAWWGLQVH